MQKIKDGCGAEIALSSSEQKDVKVSNRRPCLVCTALMSRLCVCGYNLTPAAAELQISLAVAGIQWQFNCGGKWCSMDPATTRRLFSEYALYCQSGAPSTVRLHVAGNEYTFDFSWMTQENVKTNCRREIRIFFAMCPNRGLPNPDD